MSEASALSIRPARPGDADVILDLIRALAVYEKMEDQVVATPERLQATLFGDRPQAHCLLAEVGGEAVGLAIYFYSYSTFLARKGLHLEDLYVKETFRGRGYGEAILRFLAGIALKASCGRFEWTVLDWNEPAICFYKKMGADILDEWRICRVAGAALKTLARGGIE